MAVAYPRPLAWASAGKAHVGYTRSTEHLRLRHTFSGFRVYNYPILQHVQGINTADADQVVKIL